MRLLAIGDRFGPGMRLLVRLGCVGRRSCRTLSHFSQKTREMGHPVFFVFCPIGIWSGSAAPPKIFSRRVGCRKVVNREKLHESVYLYAGWANINFKIWRVYLFHVI